MGYSASRGGMEGDVDLYVPVVEYLWSLTRNFAEGQVDLISARFC
jgi:hypothetical protein